jgi:hypothetical protein
VMGRCRCYQLGGAMMFFWRIDLGKPVHKSGKTVMPRWLMLSDLDRLCAQPTRYHSA